MVCQPSSSSSILTDRDGSPSAPVAIDPHLIGALFALQADLPPGSLAAPVITFLQALPVRLTDLVSAVDLPDRRCLAAAAHALRGSSSVLGAVGLATLCRQLEQCAETAQADEILCLTDEILREAERVQATMQVWLAGV